MKILQVVTQMEAGGAQKVASLLHGGFQDRGFEAELCFLYTKRHTYSKVGGVSSLFDGYPSKREYAKIFARLNSKIRIAKPDVVITHTHYANVMGQPAALLNRVPRRIAVHHNPLPSYPKAARFLDRLFGRLGVYSKIIAVSDSVVDTISTYPQRYKHLVSRIYNGLPSAVERDKASEIKSTLQIPHDSPLLVNVARLAKQKDHLTLLKAVERLPSVHLALLGDGELCAQLKQQAIDLGIAGRVHFVGEVSREQVFSYLYAADLFVFPSLFESMGLALVEAMQAGVPVVASDLPAMREVLGEAGKLVPPQNVSAFVGAIEYLLGNKAFADALSSRALDRARAFSLNTMLDGYAQALLPDKRKVSHSKFVERLRLTRG